MLMILPCHFNGQRCAMLLAHPSGYAHCSVSRRRHHSFVPGNKLLYEIIRNNNDDNKVVNAVGFVSLLGI